MVIHGYRLMGLQVLMMLLLIVVILGLAMVSLSNRLVMGCVMDSPAVHGGTLMMTLVSVLLLVMMHILDRVVLNNDLRCFFAMIEILLVMILLLMIFMHGGVVRGLVLIEVRWGMNGMSDSVTCELMIFMLSEMLTSLMGIFLMHFDLSHVFVAMMIIMLVLVVEVAGVVLVLQFMIFAVER